MYALSSTITSNQHHYLFLCPNYASLQRSRKLRNLCKTLLTHCKYQSAPYCIFLICIISPSYDLLDHQSLHVVWLHVGAMLQFLLLAPLREYNSIKYSDCTIPFPYCMISRALNSLFQGTAMCHKGKTNAKIKCQWKTVTQCMMQKSVSYSRSCIFLHALWIIYLIFVSSEWDTIWWHWMYLRRRN